MRYQLFDLNNADYTREYLLKEFGLGVNLPCIHYEEEKWGQRTFKFVIGTYSYTQRGLHVLEGECVNSCVDKFEILSCGMLMVFEEGRTVNQDTRDWLVYSGVVKWLYDYNIQLQKRGFRGL